MSIHHIPVGAGLKDNTLCCGVRIGSMDITEHFSEIPERRTCHGKREPMSGLSTMMASAALTLKLTDKRTGRQIVFGPDVMYDVLVEPQYNNGGNFMREVPPSGYVIEATADFLGAFQRTEPMRELQERPQIGGTS